jgi:GDP-L-fucose synthase
MNTSDKNPDGALRKLLDRSRLRAFGWQPAVDFEEGLKGTYQWHLDNALSTEACS